MKSILKAVTVLTLAATVAACGNMTKKQRNTAIGVAVGAAAGHAVGESTGATLGGAALGGLIGSQVR